MAKLENIEVQKKIISPSSDLPILGAVGSAPTH
jgi:hypothetical protein